MPTLSVILITQNEEANIRDCLNSVSFADEIIVVDSGSTDSTVELCRSFTQQVFCNDDWQGFGVQKNRALDQAQSEWILSIDADERVTPALRAEIQQVVQHRPEVAFRIPRCSHYCGRWIKHSGWQPDYVTRLFRRESARFSNDLVHEQVQLLSGKIGTLRNPLLHYSFTSLEEVLDKINHYSSASAQMLKNKRPPSSLKKAIFHGLWTFCRTYFLKRGFLDGREGFMLAVSNAEGTYYRYLKLMYLQEHVNHKCDSDHL